MIQRVGFLSLVLSAVLASVVGPVHAAETAPVEPSAVDVFLNRLLPLPQEIQIQRQITVSPDEISVTLASGSGAVVEKAVEDLRRGLGLSDTEPESQPGLRITLGLLDDSHRLAGKEIPDGARLRELPNNTQAYLMTPVGDSEIVIAALHPDGISFAVRTLLQLVNKGDEGKTLIIPLASIVDWPDLEERGVWNFPPTREWIDWMAGMKLNYGNLNPEIQPIERGKPNRMKIDRELFDHANSIAFRFVPQIVHLNFLDSYGLFRAYPELAGIGDRALAGRYFAHKEGPQHRVPDASNPLLADILAEWMVDLASQGAKDVCCWLTERPAADSRPIALAEGQFVLEARAFVKAWEKACVEHPDLSIRMFLSTTTDERYHRIYHELPPDMKIFRCCVTDMERVPHLPRDLFRNPLLDHYAGEGRWIGTYDVPLNVNGNVETPEFKIPHRSPHRIRDYVRQLVERRYRAGIGMMAWHRHASKICGLNIAALAEWGWNSTGRTEREFAVAWATREGLADPEAFADWSDLMGPVEFDVFDSEFPICYSWGLFADLIEKGEFPVLGEGVFRYYTSPQSFDEKAEACDRALRIAEEFEDPDYAAETRVVRSYTRLAHSIYLIAKLLAVDDLTTLDRQDDLKGLLDRLEQAGKENVEATSSWRSGLGDEDWHYRVKDAVAGTENTVRRIHRFAADRYLY